MFQEEVMNGFPAGGAVGDHHILPGFALLVLFPGISLPGTNAGCILYEPKCRRRSDNVLQIPCPALLRNYCVQDDKYTEFAQF